MKLLKMVDLVSRQPKNGAEAITILDELSTRLRGLVTDINSAWVLTDGISHVMLGNFAPKSPVVYMSGASSHEWASHGVPNSTLVTKPFAPAQIVTAISALINISDTHAAGE